MSAYPSRFAPAATLEAARRQLRADLRRARLTHPSCAFNIGESDWHWSDLKAPPAAADDGTAIHGSAPPFRASSPLAAAIRVAPWHA